MKEQVSSGALQLQARGRVVSADGAGLNELIPRFPQPQWSKDVELHPSYFKDKAGKICKILQNLTESSFKDLINAGAVIFFIDIWIYCKYFKAQTIVWRMLSKYYNKRNKENL